MDIVEWINECLFPLTTLNDELRNVLVAEFTCIFVIIQSKTLMLSKL